MIAELVSISKIYEVAGTGIRNLVLDSVSLAVNKNESVAITGPSGSGKSTLLNILGTLDVPSSGIVKLNNTLTTELQPSALAKIRNQYLGFVFQQHYLLPQLTLLENVLLPTLPLFDVILKKDANQNAKHLLEKVGLADQMGKYPSQISVGECQRAAVVRALINKPELLLADEPTGSLDAENASHLVDVLLDLKNEQLFSMVIVTHSLDLAKRMDKIYKLSSAKLTINA